MKLERTLIALALLGFAATGWSQGWSPQRNVELVVGFAAGGGVDKTARTLERILASGKLVTTGMTVVNKPGGGTSVAYTYVSQRPPDGHTLMVVGPGLVSNHIMGSSALSHTDFALIASLTNEYIVFSVSAAAPIRTGQDLVERMKKDSKSVTFGFSSIGSASHIVAALFNKAIGGKPRDLKAVTFKGSADSITNLLGGHVDITSTPTAVAVPHLANGQTRIVAVSAPRRLGGVLAGVATWKEQGLDLVFGTWRVVIGPKGMSAAQIAYWENALRKATESAEWKADLESNFWVDDFATGAQLRKDLDRDYADTKAVLVDLGLAKQ